MKNVVLITVDSLRADYILGDRTPDSLEILPQLADEWLSFSNAFSNASHTKQSFLSIMSGTYPWTFDSTEGGYDEERPHIAELLSDSGYATGGFNTNTYLGPVYGYGRGFDYFLGRDTEQTDGVGSRLETAYDTLTQRVLTVGGASNLVHWMYKTAGERLGIQLGSRLYKPAEELNDAVIGWTRRCPRPAFVWVHYMDVHTPYYPHEGTISEGISRKRAVKLFHRVTDLRNEASSQDIEDLERLYKGEIEYLDRQIGDLLVRLDETLGLEDTLIVFTSDHGEAFDEHGHVFHPGSALYDENIHIPMIIRDEQYPHETVQVPVSNVDIVPTILSEAGIDHPSVLEGADVTSFVTRAPEERLVFTESYDPEDGGVMVTNGAYKLVRDLDMDTDQLYSRSPASGETLVSPDDHPAVHDRLTTALNEHVRSARRADRADTDSEVSEDVRLQLKKLGYDE